MTKTTIAYSAEEMIVEDGQHVRDALEKISAEVAQRMDAAGTSHYGHAGDLQHVRSQLREITDFLTITQEGA